MKKKVEVSLDSQDEKLINYLIEKISGVTNDEAAILWSLDIVRRIIPLLITDEDKDTDFTFLLPIQVKPRDPYESEAIPPGVKPKEVDPDLENFVEEFLKRRRGGKLDKGTDFGYGKFTGGLDIGDLFKK